NASFTSPTYSSGAGATDGISCISSYEASDGDPNKMIRYRFNSSTGDIELESGVTCNEMVATTVPFEFIIDNLNSPTINMYDLLKLDFSGSYTFNQAPSNYNFTVDWGDEVITGPHSNGSGAISHTYASQSGAKTIKINGVLNGFKFTYATGMRILSSIEKWGIARLYDNSEMLFAYSSDFTHISPTAGTIDTSNVTSFEYAFVATDNFNSPLDNWVTSNVTNMRNMFVLAKSFNSSISGWDVSSVTDMYRTFSDAQSFDQDISSWNVDNVTACYEFETLTPASWITAEKPVFNNCTSGY
ncbi:MAG: surface protein, partial [Ulvibacter sp.]